MTVPRHEKGRYMQEKSRVFFDSDLAEERHKATFQNGGIDFEKHEKDGVSLTRLTVKTQEGASMIGKGIGRYLTVSTVGAFRFFGESVLGELKGALCELLPKAASRFLIVGLGNRRSTADSIGVRTAENLTASENVGIYIPRTEGETGIESALLVKGAVSVFHPDALIVIDALAARESERLLSCAELSDTGISPGTGIGMRRTPISKETMGVFTVAIGIPTVMRAQSFIKSIVGKDSAADIREKAEGLFVIPQALDEGVRAVSAVLSEGIRLFLEERHCL